METWQSLEDKVRWIAEIKWATPCAAEDIAGVRIDAVCKISNEEWVVIEISKENNLRKLREDLAKMMTVKHALWARQIFARCFFVTSSDENPSLRESAESNGVRYFTDREFEATFIGGSRYVHERLLRPFGSAVKIDSGEIDDAPYVPISYVDSSGEWTVERISEELQNGHKFVLLGEFGSGKSRCTMQTFYALTSNAHNPPPLAIDLRDAWGKQTFNSIIREHLEDLGLADISDQMLRSITRGHSPILLDGFDELGTQSWSTAPEKMAEIRAAATKGVREVVTKSQKCGLLISGRDHYFSSDDEMLRLLGLPESTTILRCPEQFTVAQARRYLDGINDKLELPQWLPRKPLICQLVASLPTDDVTRLAASSTGEVDFFEKSLDVICERETRISPIIDGASLRTLLIRLALHTKETNDIQNRLSPDDVNTQFKVVTGVFPGAESSVLLQKLPYLGRFEAESADRVFIDDYVREGLAGIGMHMLASRMLSFETAEDWRKPLGAFGLRVWAECMEFGSALAFARQEASHGRYQAACDFVAASLAGDSDQIDYDGLSLVDAFMSQALLVDKKISNLSLSEVYIETAYVDGIEWDNVHIGNSYIDAIYGVASYADLPGIFREGLIVGRFDSVGMNTSAISTLDLTDSQKTLLSIVQKLFFQRGSGRKEGALFRGTAQYWDPAAATAVLKIMLKEDIVTISQGDEGKIYVPNRKHTRRMGEIRSQRKGSTDPLWLAVSPPK